MRRLLFILTLVAVAKLMTGCGGYTLRGKVIEGFDAGILVVAADDPRLDEQGVRQVRIKLHRDPGSLAEQRIASASSDADGQFEMELSAFGAGWMDEQWLMTTNRPNYRNNSEIVRLPRNANRNRVLIVVTPGQATPQEQREDLWEEYRRYR